MKIPIFQIKIRKFVNETERKWEPNWPIKIRILEIDFKNSDFGRKYGVEYEKQKNHISKS